MADFKGKAGSFLPYLGAERQRRDRGMVQPAPGSPLTLMEILARQAQRSLPIFDLQTLGSMAPQTLWRRPEELERRRLH